MDLPQVLFLRRHSVVFWELFHMLILSLVPGKGNRITKFGNSKLVKIYFETSYVGKIISDTMNEQLDQS